MEKTSLNANQLKIIAFISMIIDHSNKVFLLRFANNNERLKVISYLGQIVGRIAFPIFIYFLVEGFFHTKNRYKYLKNLFISSIISEIPFNLYVSAKPFYYERQSIMITLMLCLLMLIIIDNLKEKINDRFIWSLSIIIIVSVFSLIAVIINCDYTYKAIIIALILYILHGKKFLPLIFSYLITIKQPHSGFGFSLLHLYNGKKGEQNKLFYYLIYPTHLLIIGVLRIMLKI